ncbi:MAG: hypothetical protein AAFY11_13305, partial [Cyanobacteria bacterium J06641_5]
MAIVGSDDRTLLSAEDLEISEESVLDSVVAVDVLRQSSTDPSLAGVVASGTGVIIGPNQVLTAAHVVARSQNVTNGPDGTAARVVPGQEAVMNPRALGSSAAPATEVNATAGPATFLLPSTTGNDERGDDVALLETELFFSQAQQAGLVAFVNPSDVLGLEVTTAGFPLVVDEDNFNSIPGLQEGESRNGQFVLRDSTELGNLNFPPFNRIVSGVEDLIPGEPIRAGRRTDPGDGSGFFLTEGNRAFFATGTIIDYFPEQLDGNTVSLFSVSDTLDIEGGQSGSGYFTVLEGDALPRVIGIHNSTNDISRRAQASLITVDIYNEIVERTQGLDGNSLPENAIVGSSTSETIVGSFRRERIIGNDGNDRLFGGEGNDRLEGGDGVDQALFSGTFRPDSFVITDSDDASFLFTGVDGSDPVTGIPSNSLDTTQNIEFGIFEIDDPDGDGIDDDGQTFMVPLEVDPTG